MLLMTSVNRLWKTERSLIAEMRMLLTRVERTKEPTFSFSSFSVKRFRSLLVLSKILNFSF